MARSKQVSRIVCRHAPTSLLVALLGALRRAGEQPDRILRIANAPYEWRDLAAGAVEAVDSDCFILVSRACHAALRDSVARTSGESSLSQEQLSILCRCLTGCADLAEAIHTTATFLEMFRGQMGRITLETSGRTARLYVRTVRDVHNAAATALAVYNAAVIHLLYEWLIDQPVSLAAVEFTCPHASDDGLSLSLFSSPVEFEQEANCMSFDVAYLKQPVVRRQVDLTPLLQGFPYELFLRERQRGSLAEHMYVAMIDAHVRHHRIPSVDQVAELFGITSWTLRRRLADEGTAYSAIRKRCQLNLATDFLRRAELTINEIADMANFSDAGAFRRAFQQWTGRSPSAYREQLLRA
jgi:AraC-like DNA-binding protein